LKTQKPEQQGSNDLRPPSFVQDLGDELTRIREQGLERGLLPVQPLEGAWIAHKGRKYLNLASNDYLGLATNRALLEEFYQGITKENIRDCFGPGSTASRLMTGTHEVNAALERQLATLYGREQSLVFSSGYHANIGILPALAGAGDLILADKLCHASLLDGMRLSRARVIRYPHLDYARLERLLAEKRSQYRRVFVVSESVFSMDGDCADLGELVRLKNSYQAILYLDEAHAVGIRGPNGLGVAAEQGVLPEVEILLGTFGKAYGGQGAFILGSSPLCSLLLNKARSFIFTTGLPPVALSWLLFIVRKMATMDDKRRRVQDLSDWLRRALQKQGLSCGGRGNILPVQIGDAEEAVRVAESLRGHGFWAHAVRPPTVPAGTSRLRLSITAAMEQDDLLDLPGLIAEAMAS